MSEPSDSTQPVSEPDPERLLTIEQTAEKLQLPVHVVRTFVKTGALAHMRWRNYVRIHPLDIEDLRLRLTVKARPVMVLAVKAA